MIFISNDNNEKLINDEETVTNTVEQEKEAQNIEVNEKKESAPKILLAKKTNKEKSNFLFISFLAALLFIAAFFIFLSFTSIASIFTSSGDKLERQLQGNTVTIQRYVDQAIHDIDLYEASQNENYIIQLQIDLAKMTTLLEQSTKLHDSLYINNDPNKREEKLLYNIQLHSLYLEDILKGKITFVPENIFIFRHQLETVSQSLSNHPQISYEDFVNKTNRVLDTLYLDWSRNDSK